MQTSRLCVLQKRSYCHQSFGLGIGIFDIFCSYDLDLDPMTFIYELNRYSFEIGAYWMCENELRMSRLSKVVV